MLENIVTENEKKLDEIIKLCKSKYEECPILVIDENLDIAGYGAELMKRHKNDENWPLRGYEIDFVYQFNQESFGNIISRQETWAKKKNKQIIWIGT